MALKRVARDVLPSTAMAAVDDCLLLKGVKPTDAFALELWNNLALAAAYNEPLWAEDEWKIIYVLTTKRVGKEDHKIFIINLMHGDKRARCGDFLATAQGLIDMSARIKEFREIARRGMCPCENPPKRPRLEGFNGCAMCFLKE